MRFTDATHGRLARRCQGVWTPATSRCWMSASKHAYATHAIGSANLDTEAPLTG
ncbi:MAG TPA: hypothetical protein VN796_09720 [Acidimicrobiales bacterium]|nr:hypothetical protein [Acidimicrobiales bacterium]